MSAKRIPFHLFLLEHNPQRRKEGETKLRISRAVQNESLFLRTKVTPKPLFLNQWVVDDCFMGLINEIVHTNLKYLT